jgi:hypothetical protein
MSEFDNKLIKECMFNILELNKKLNSLSDRINSIENPTRCECILNGYEPGNCRKRSVCSEKEKTYHTEKCWKNLTAPYGAYLCTCEDEETEEDEAYNECPCCA